jgi:hypothetical protein
MPSTKWTGLAALMLIVGTLAGCGGGGGGESVIPPTEQATQPLQGLWQGSYSPSQLPASAAVLPDGRVWFVMNDANNDVRLITGGLGVQGSSFSGGGKEFVPGVTGVSAATINATVTAKSQLQGSFNVNGVTNSFSMTYQPRYEIPAVLSDVVGAWMGALSNGAVSVTWDITASGAVTGQSTTGCSYGGQFQTRSEAKAILEVAVTESCAGTTKRLTGVASLNQTKSTLSVTTTLADESAAVLLLLQR